MSQDSRKEFTMHRDRLLEILFEHIDKAAQTPIAEAELLREVAAQFIHELMGQGNIPHYLLDVLETDLLEELQEAYRKKTYGAFNPSDFHRTRKKPQRRRKVTQ